MVADCNGHASRHPPVPFRSVETTSERTPTGLGPGARLLAWTLVALMAIGSIAVWLVSPVAWIWIASQMQDGSQPQMGPYLLVMVGLLVTTIVLARALGWLNRRHIEVTKVEVDQRRTPWLRSMRAERKTASNNGVLDVVMLISVGCALAVAGVWFFFFAGSSLPGA